jgi:hypothetical protein
MILCEFTPAGGEMIRCAMEDFANIHLWKSYIVSLSSLKISMPSVRGGYAQPTFTDISFSPDMGRYANATVRVLWVTDGDETNGTVIFDGTARLSSPEYSAIKYKLKRAENATKIPESTVYVDTLNNVMATLCGPTLLDKTLDTSRARIPSPAVSYTTTTEMLTKDFASQLCESFCHGLIEQGNTLYLVDMFDITTNQQDVDRFDVIQSSTNTDAAYSTAKNGDYAATSTTVLNGDEFSVQTIYHGTEANILECLGNILEVMNRPVVQLDAWIKENPQIIGGCYVFTDDLHFEPMQSIFVCSDVVYNFDTDVLQATGAGAIS